MVVEKATLIVAYLRNYLHFCFLKDGQEEFTLDLKIESEIGDQRRQGFSPSLQFQGI